ncbi:MAG: AAC(3) family N-acetyltransferase [Anaerolineales bacterium]|jgi:aminoglycoside 3-N-acetyltransferase|nr:AAC(3) family N-acetyltransferase [Anaerolineales bacterium]
MRRLGREQLAEALGACGLHRGDGVLVHAALQFLGQPQGGLEMIFSTLCDVLGIDPQPGRPAGQEEGTLAVPTFNFDFARGVPYHPGMTPSKGMGALAEFVRKHPAALRTPHPMQSIAVLGRHARDLAARDTASAFDPGSAFERMLELDFKILLLGADVQAISLLHYSEQRTGVPYRYWKEFCGLVHTPAAWEPRVYRMFVRDLQLNPVIELYPVQAMLEQRRQWASIEVNYGFISACRMVDFVQALDECLVRDLWSLVTNRSA